MKKWKAIAGVILVFLLGALAGAIATNIVCQRKIESIMEGGPAAKRAVIVRRLTRELRLDAEQQRQLLAIVTEAHAEMKKVRSQVQPQIDAVMDRSADKVRAILTPGQREKFDRIIAEKKARMRRED